MFAIIGGPGTGLPDIASFLNQEGKHLNITSLVSETQLECELTLCNMIKPLLSAEDWVEKIKPIKNREFVTGVSSLPELIALRALGYVIVHLDIPWNERLKNIASTQTAYSHTVKALSIWSNATVKTELFDNLYPNIVLKSDDEIADFLSRALKKKITLRQPH